MVLKLSSWFSKTLVLSADTISIGSLFHASTTLLEKNLALAWVLVVSFVSFFCVFLCPCNRACSQNLLCLVFGTVWKVIFISCVWISFIKYSCFWQYPKQF